MEIEVHLAQMEMEFSNSIDQTGIIDNAWGSNSEIRWYANEADSFSDEKITDFYLQNKHARNSRWDLYHSVIKTMKHHNITNNIDIGAANNHFSFLALMQGISSYGIDPRRNFINSSNETFHSFFGKDKRYGFVGSIRTFSEYTSRSEVDLKTDCVTILNFLHAGGHNSQEIEGLFSFLVKGSKYLIATEPNWSLLGITNLFNNFEIIENIHFDHKLYRVR